MEAEFGKSSGEVGFLVFSSFDEEGNIVSPPEASLWVAVWRRVWRRNPRSLSNRLFQLQVWSRDDRSLDDSVEMNVRSLMLSLREDFVTHFRTRDG